MQGVEKLCIFSIKKNKNLKVLWDESKVFNCEKLVLLK